jgi:hypothetical protein
MDVRCSQTFLQEMPIQAEKPERCQSQGLRAFLLCFLCIDQRELQVIFRSAGQHFEGHGNKANLFWMGKRDILGSWIQRDDVVHTASFVAVIQFSKTMIHLPNLIRHLRNWRSLWLYASTISFHAMSKCINLLLMCMENPRISLFMCETFNRL